MNPVNVILGCSQKRVRNFGVSALAQSKNETKAKDGKGTLKCDAAALFAKEKGWWLGWVGLT